MNRETRPGPRRSGLARWGRPLTFLSMLALAFWYSLHVSMAQTITPPGPVSKVHSNQFEDQVFAEQTWTLTNSSVKGATATWTCAPFKHVKHDRKADCRMKIRILTKAELSNWEVVNGFDTDETDYKKGTNSALVKAASNFSGGATVGLTVTFVQEPVLNLASGDYQTTIEGTITAN